MLCCRAVGMGMAMAMIYVLDGVLRRGGEGRKRRDLLRVDDGVCDGEVDMRCESGYKLWGLVLGFIFGFIFEED